MSLHGLKIDQAARLFTPLAEMLVEGQGYTREDAARALMIAALEQMRQQCPLPLVAQWLRDTARSVDASAMANDAPVPRPPLHLVPDPSELG